jgi:hypothetical protein
MASDAPPVERLRQYLRALPPGSRALLIAELERALLRGEEIPGGDMLLQEVRTAVRESARERAPRVDNPARLFFRPLEPFLIDAGPARRTLSRLPRTVIEHMWTWIARDLVPAEAQRYIDGMSRVLASGGDPSEDALTFAFHDRVIGAMNAALAAAAADDKARRQLAGQIGTTSALDDLRDVLTILTARDALELIKARLPGHIRNLAGGPLENLKALLDSPLVSDRRLLPYALVVLLGRLAAPWQLIRLAVKDADSDDAARIAGTPYAAAVTIVLDDVERMVEELRADLKRGIASTSLIKCIHDAARGLRTELDLSADSPWARQLAAIRSEIASMLRAEIESAPGRMRRLLRPRPASQVAPNSALNADEVTEVERLIELVGACRNYAGELAISEMTLRTFQEIQQYLDTGTRALLDGLRGAGDADRSFRRSQVDAAVRFCAKAFGKDYAALLTKAAELAASPERTLAARA